MERHYEPPYVAHILCISDELAEEVRDMYVDYIMSVGAVELRQSHPLEGDIPTVKTKFFGTSSYLWNRCGVTFGIGEYVPRRKRPEVGDRELVTAEIVGEKDDLETMLGRFRSASHRRGIRTHIAHKGPCLGSRKH